MHGVGFFDNPGLCYSPFTVNWDDILEYPDLQQVILVPMNDKVATLNWLNDCTARYGDKSQVTSSTTSPTFSTELQSSESTIKSK